MALNVWGLLEKSQSDSEKIEEAIDRLISEHNDDEDSHLETGQSLQSHKASAIIDHLALSIVEDKLANSSVTSDKITTNQIVAKDFRTASDVGSSVDGVKFYSGGIEVWKDSEKVVDIPVVGNNKFLGQVLVNILGYLRHTWIGNFESVDGYQVHLDGGGDSITPNFQALIMVNSATIGNFTTLAVGEIANIVPAIAKNPSLQFSFHGQDLWGQDVYMVWGSDDPFDSSRSKYFGFKVDHADDDKIYACWRTSSINEETEELSGIDPNDKHLYRAEVTDGGDYIKFYVDNVLIYTAEPSWSSWTSDYLFAFSIESQAEENHNNFFWDLVIQQDL